MSERPLIVSEDKVKNLLITRTAIKTLQSEDIVEKIINHQFKDAITATKKYNEVEFSGLGKFITSKAKLKRKLQAKTNLLVYLNKQLIEGTPDKTTSRILREIAETEKYLEYVKTKLKKYED